mmetsp:Transcript_3391/g.5708  ORF Transcript_3391/g.5708 Transcript_3391/m.5708 type:complete len:402 (+) Transcript_3391:103-1308(+)
MTDYFKSREVTVPVQPMHVSAQGDLAAVALIDGRVVLTRIRGGSETQTSCEDPTAVVRTWQAHNVSCRSSVFLNGDALVSGDAEGNIHVSSVERGGARVLTHEPAAAGNKAPLRDDGEEASGDDSGSEFECGASCLASLGDGNTFAVGYDDGTVSTFDKRTLMRESKPNVQLSKHTDFVSDMAVTQSGHQVVTSSGDGTLCLLDLRKGKLVARSEDDADDEMLSVVLVKGEKKVVCGHQSGVMGIYSWGYWNDCSDRFPGHPGSVDSIVKIDEDTVLTGSSDGLIRIVSILPNKALGIVGEHLADNPIEHLCLEPEHRETLLSISHNNVVKLWSVGELLEEDDSSDTEDTPGSSDSEDSEKESAPAKKKQKKNKKEKKKTKGMSGFKNSDQAQRSAFFADM